MHLNIYLKKVYVLPFAVKRTPFLSKRLTIKDVLQLTETGNNGRSVP